MAIDLDANHNGAIDFHEFLNMIPGIDRTYAYTTGYTQLALVNPKFLLTGRPFGKTYNMVIWDTLSRQKLYEHTFQLHL